MEAAKTQNWTVEVPSSEPYKIHLNSIYNDNRLIAADYNSRKRQTRPLVRESAPYQEACICLEEIRIWS
jgi:hypothetical protein